MKVLRIIARLNVGGPAKHVAWLEAGLRRRGVESLLVAGVVPPGEDDMSYFAEGLGVRWQVIPEMSREVSPKDAVTVWKLYRLFRRERPDVVHTHTAKAGTVGRAAGMLYRWLTPSALLGRPRACRFVHTYHGHIFHSYYGRWKTRLFLLVEQALARLDDDSTTAANRLLSYWNGETSARDDYLSRAILRPYAEVMRAHNRTPDRLHRQGHCPFCGGAPIVSSRRSMPDAEAGQRMLHCALCGLEWNVNRILCPSCFESDPDKLPVYGSDAHPNARIEACETCRRYVKSIDTTKDARQIAEIDDLASIALDLWAIDEGLTRIEPGLAGL
jgi:hypothetical protein